MRALTFIIAFALTIGAGSARADDRWTRTDTALELTFAGIVLVDVMQTRSFLTDRADGRCWDYACPRRVETNPFLGDRPTRLDIYTYSASVTIAHAVVARLLPQPYRRHWQVLWIGIETGIVAGNAMTVGGIRLSF